MKRKFSNLFIAVIGILILSACSVINNNDNSNIYSNNNLENSDNNSSTNVVAHEIYNYYFDNQLIGSISSTYILELDEISNELSYMVDEVLFNVGEVELIEYREENGEYDYKIKYFTNGSIELEFLIENNICTITGCSKSVSEIIIPSKILLEGHKEINNIKIGENAFKDCISLTNIVVSSGVTSIGSSAFSGCSSLERITLPFVGESKDSNQYFGYIFGANLVMENSSYVPSSLKEVIILEGCIRIEEVAFYECKSLTSIFIPSSVTSIGTDAFFDCFSLTVYCEASSEPSGWDGSWNYDCQVYWGVAKEDIIEQNGIQYLIIDGNALITRYIGNDSNVVIPESIEVNNVTYNVTSIGKRAFSYCLSLTSIVIPSSITSIGYVTFKYCRPFKDVYYEGSIEDWCKISFSGYANPMFWASHFYIKDENNEYKEVTEIIIPNSVTSIGNNQFCGFSNVKSIVIPSSVTSIGNGAFENCSSLTSIVIPSSVTSIGRDAFNGCDTLTIYCEADSQPRGWNSNWNSSDCKVVWGYEG